MSIQIKFFGPLADVVGTPQLNVNGISDTESLRRRMLNDYPKLKEHQFMVIISKQIVKENINLREGDVVTLLPPFSGG
jgi:molybdopterin converting factor small subunit